MGLKFAKMHGLGNDYVYIETFTQAVDAPEQLAKRLSDRHHGVGSDGLILIAPPLAVDAAARMIMYNADGSRGQMCGNGIRCVAKYVHDRGICRRNPLRIETDRGLLQLELTLGADHRVELVRVDMGPPILEASKIPVALRGPHVIDTPVPVGDRVMNITCVSMGNPHGVIFADQLVRVPLSELGPQLERHPVFPERANIHFAQRMAADQLKVMTWERGAGVTQACGTGACAAAVAGVLNRLTDRAVTVSLPGGELQIEWDEATDHVFMIGPATHVFDGELNK